MQVNFNLLNKFLLKNEFLLFKTKLFTGEKTMSGFEFVNHESFPEDEYTKEAVTLCFDGKYRVTYVRKKMQNGGLFWSEISVAVKVHGEKKYLKAFSQDSNFLQDDIRTFLDGRSWEKSRSAQAAAPAGGYVAQKQSDDGLPF
jgi:hypothetical protein